MISFITWFRKLLFCYSVAFKSLGLHGLTLLSSNLVIFSRFLWLIIQVSILKILLQVLPILTRHWIDDNLFTWFKPVFLGPSRLRLVVSVPVCAVLQAHGCTLNVVNPTLHIFHSSTTSSFDSFTSSVRCFCLVKHRCGGFNSDILDWNQGNFHKVFLLFLMLRSLNVVTYSLCSPPTLDWHAFSLGSETVLDSHISIFFLSFDSKIVHGILQLSKVIGSFIYILYIQKIISSRIHRSLKCWLLVMFYLSLITSHEINVITWHPCPWKHWVISSLLFWHYFYNCKEYY